MGEKVQSNQKFIETRRKNVSFGVGDRQQIEVWEAQVLTDGTPLIAFYKNWKKVTDLAQAKKVSDQQKLDDYAHIPMLKKNIKKMQMKKERAEVEEVTGFLSGSDEDDFDDEENFKLKEERGKRKNSESEEEEVVSPKKAKKEVKPVKEVSKKNTVPEESSNEEDGDDLVEDMKLEDLDSGSDEEDLQDEFNAENGVDSDDSDSDDESD